MAQPNPRRGTNPIAIFWIVTAAAFLIRLIYLVQLSDPSLNPAFVIPTGDPGVHHRWAQQLLTGAWPGPEPFFRAPLYPYFLGALYAVFGPQHALSVQIVHALVAALGAGLAALCAYRLWSATAAWCAGLLLACLWPSIYFSGELLAVTLSVTLNLLLLWLVLGPLTARRLLFLGAVLGLSAITRPTVLVITPAVVWYIWRRVGFRPQGHAVGWLWFVAGLMLTIGPVSLRNLIRGGEPVLIAASGGVNFYIGNNSYADGRVAFLPGAPPAWQGELSDALTLAATETGREMSAQQADRYFWGQGLRFWQTEPGAALRLLARKSWLLVAAGARSNNRNLAFWRARSPLLRWPIWPGWAFVLALSVLGLTRPDLDRQARILLLGMVLSYAAALLLFFINARFRLPVLAWLVVPAGGGLAALVEAWRHRNWASLPRTATMAAVVVGLLSFVPDALTYHQDPATDFGSWRALGNSYLANGDRARVITTWEKALSIDDREPLSANRWLLPQIYQPLAQLYQQQQRSDMALDVYRRWVQRLPDSVAGRMGLANLLLQSGHPAAAGENLTAVLKLDPDNHNARLGLAWSLHRRQKWEPALQEFEKVSTSIDSPSADYGVGLCRLGLGRPADAEEQFQDLVRRHPQFVQAWESLAGIYAETARPELERQAWQAVLKYRPSSTRARQRLGVLR